LEIFLTVISKIGISQFHTIGFSEKPRIQAPSIITEGRLSEKLFKDTVADLDSGASLPLSEIKFTSNFGWRLHPIDQVLKIHGGVDLRAYYEPVYAFGEGVAIQVGYDDKAGNYIVLNHGAGRLKSVYAHLEYIAVEPGQLVKSGEMIGVSGNTGYSTAPHLHFGLKYEGKEVDPLPVLRYLIWEKINCLKRQVACIDSPTTGHPGSPKKLSDSRIGKKGD